MASANGAMLIRMVVPAAACIALFLLSMGPPVMADIQDDCRLACVRECTDFVSKACKKVIVIAPILKIKPSFLQKCKVQVSPMCIPTCNHFCINLTLGAPTPRRASPAPPPRSKP
ncbi:unnamed protein product [Urochloa humidicola]